MICNKKSWKAWQVYYQLLFAILIGFSFFSVILPIQYIYIIGPIVIIVYFLSFIKYQNKMIITNIYQQRNLWKFYFYPVIVKIINISDGKCHYQTGKASPYQYFS
ncbi:hypothetical protein C6B38_00630 [Spiroplasma sp. ChiS]|uniref:hypothetical protein n=1 Tax=Spiroplasma sp. ChiS TaxID=2099885 RepID=UPI000CFA6DFE|nr:hypothetical protein [Spiroplasma sp. ChiS]PQP79607.1 hypothetical protein C6B38_00630 [Spiroplasma sp. ChiS]